jgi:very-short-patch-repair endonuclease
MGMWSLIRAERKDVMTHEYDPSTRDRVTRLMGVLRQMAAARYAPIRTVDRYHRTLWLHDAQQSTTVQSLEGPGSEVLRVSRVLREPEPAAPRELRRWLDRHGRDDLVEPGLKERVGIPGQGVVELTERPTVLGLFHAWIADWRVWAEQERLRRPRREVFETLFDLHRLAQDQPESVELVLATGLLQTPEPTSVRVHMISQAVRVEQDLESGDMICVLAEDSGLRLEDDELLAGLEAFDLSGSPLLREKLLERATSPIDPALPEFLKEWAARVLQIAHTVDDTWELLRGDQAMVSMSPAVVARPRGAYAIRAYYDAIAASLADESTPVPLGLAQLVEAIEPNQRLAWLDRTGFGGASVAEAPLFPLPANEEQAQIIQRLDADSGVVVEGPPGTGKTHTIANLVSALLAQGKRVLVTAEKAQALRVLRDKLPPEMQELCVSLTDASAKGNSDLSRSVAMLAGRKTDFNPGRADREIDDLTAKRAEVQRDRARLLEEIRAVREAETFQHPEIAPGFRGTLAQIAARIGETEERDGWLGKGTKGGLPLTASELEELLRLLAEETDERRARREQQLPSPELLLDRALFEELTSAVALGDSVRRGESSALVATLEGLDAEHLVQLGPACVEADEALLGLRDLRAHREWARDTTSALLGGAGPHAWQSATERLQLVDAAVHHDQAAAFAEVAVLAEIDLRAAAQAFATFATHLDGGGSLRRMFKSAEQKAVAPYETVVLVSGRPVDSAASARAAAHHLAVLAVVQQINAAFAPLRTGIPLGEPRVVLIDLLQQLRTACAAVARVLDATSALRTVLGTLPPAARPALYDIGSVEQVTAVTVQVTHARSATIARDELDRVRDRLVAAVPLEVRPPELPALLQAIEDADPPAYAEALASLARAERQRADQLRSDTLMERAHLASPELATEMRDRPLDAAWTARLRFWPEAWARSCAATWLDVQVDPGREQRLEADLAIATKDLARLTGRLAAARSWRSCLARMSATQVQALQSYKNNMANVGKGTGKYAERYRQAARDAMRVAQDAVPAWVMPIQQVLASVPPRANAFDVVIVDEASQAELTSAFLLWLAPRVIVVGDDKQCTPSEVASGSLQPVFDRIDSELHDIPQYLRTSFTPRDSVFSLLRSRFGQVIRLREHFRCMPEIIEWCSNSFYRDAPLVPLRQFGADRLPPLRSTYVEGGYTEGTSSRMANVVEAEEIAQTLAGCLDDEAYDGLSFGVVVLQGHAQVDIIQSELKRLVDPEEWDRRRIRVGTPPEFQGDERNVVFLSMVVAPGERAPMALTKRDFEQRFNVAVSRAQDQLWLFHSVTADLLRPTDLRRSLLDYVTSGTGAQLDPVLADVTRHRRHDAFDSLFEQRVFLDLVERGYHVTPQVETNGRRIDLVVTGAAGKLAVECDGDAFHTTPEQQLADLHREQELKRCGWTFQRVRQSEYVLNAQRALAPVWAELDTLGIGPLGGSWVVREGNEDAEDADGPPPAEIEPEPTPIETAVEPASPPLQEDEDLTPVLGIPVVPPANDVAEGDDDPDADRSALILMMAGRGALSSAQVAGVLAIGRQEARAMLNLLVDEGRLERVGRTKGTHYVIPGSENV